MRRLDGRYAGEPGAQVPRLAAPEDGDQWSAAAGECLDCALGDLLPALASVAAGGAGSDGQDAVEEQNAPLGPRREVSGGGRCEAEVAVQLSVDIDQGARQRSDVGGDREGQSDRVSRRRIRVLADDEYPHVVQWLGEGSQDVMAGREVAVTMGDLLAEEYAEVSQGMRGGGERGNPRGVDEVVEGAGAHEVQATGLGEAAWVGYDRSIVVDIGGLPCSLFLLGVPW